MRLDTLIYIDELLKEKFDEATLKCRKEESTENLVEVRKLEHILSDFKNHDWR